jgi:hypothetical protein
LGSVTGAVGSVTGNVGGSVGSVTAGVTVTTNNDKTGYSLTVTPPTAAQNATAVWQDTTAGDFTVASSVGKGLYTTGAVPGAAGGLAIVGSAMTLATTAVQAVWDKATSALTTAGSIGKWILDNASGGGGGGGTVDTDAIVDGVVAGLLGQNIIVQSPVGKGSLEIVSGDAYLTADDRQLDFVKPSGANWPDDLSAWTITLNATKVSENPSTTGTVDSIATTGSVVVATGTGQQVRVELTTTQTADLVTGAGNRGWKFAVVATNTNDRATLVTGLMTVIENVTP